MLTYADMSGGRDKEVLCGADAERGDVPEVSYTPPTRLLHASYTPLTRLLHVHIGDVRGGVAAGVREVPRHARHTAGHTLRVKVLAYRY
jgi:hypothetical protein